MTSAVATDVLSEAFDLIEVRGLVTGGFAARGSWVSHTAVTRPLKLVALVAGSVQLTVDGPGGPDGPVALAPGDVALLNHRTRIDVRSGRSDGVPVELVPEVGFDSMKLASADLATDDVLVGGCIEVSEAGLPLLSAAVPGLVHVPADSPTGSRMGSLVEQLFEEVSAQRMGSAFAIRQNAQLLLLEVLRGYLAQEEPPIGWLRLLNDAPLAPALRLIHQQPGRRWGLAELAHATNMSRTSFAERFRTVAGAPPLTYLSRWRMVLAQRALRDPDIRVGALAAQLGYGSESAFSTAFKREVGESPLHYRRRSVTAN